MSIIGKIIKIGILLMVIVGVAYVGACVYGNYSPNITNPYKIPDADSAKYSVTVKNTGNLLYSNDVKQEGDIIIIKGFWELQGQKFVYRDIQFILDREVFGPVTVKERY